MLRQSISLIIWLLAGVVPVIMAKSQLAITESFKILALNGQVYVLPQKLMSQHWLTLYPGVNKVAIQYQSEYKLDNEQIQSQILIMTIRVLDQQKYRQVFIRPNNERSSQAFAEKPYFKLLDQQNNPLQFQLDTLEEQQSLESATSLAADKPNRQVRF